MPRIARDKSNGNLFHIISRSISEVDLFKTDNDKDKYMTIIKEYQYVYNFKVFAYCLMDNHVHLIIDSNGADISKIMHCINFKYARYYNDIHKRHGHLFQDRFKSKVVLDNRYLIVLSAYIHNNPLDIPEYENSPEKYHYSSLAVYLGLKKDVFNILEENFILKLLGSTKLKARERYVNLVIRTRTIFIDDITEQDIEFSEPRSEYRDDKKILVRDFKIEDIILFITNVFQIDKSMLHLKYRQNLLPIKGILVLLLRNLCNISCKDICSILGNITSSRVSGLCSIGVEVIRSSEKYRNIVNEFIYSYSK